MRHSVLAVSIIVIISTSLFGCGQAPAQLGEEAVNSHPSTGMVNEGPLVQLPEGSKVDRHPGGDTITLEEAVSVVGNTLVVEPVSRTLT